jgi:hypothetical protein
LPFPSGIPRPIGNPIITTTIGGPTDTGRDRYCLYICYQVTDFMAIVLGCWD